MVEIVLGIAVFVLAIAVVGLFAMMGELSSQVAGAAQPARLDQAAAPDHLHPVPEARIGAAPAKWPAELAAIRDAERAHVLVFSTTCTTCARIASGETGPLDLPSPMAIVVSTPRAAAATAFLESHPMITNYPHLVDVGGSWLSSNFEISISPSVLVFGNGQLLSAHTFTAASTLTQLPAAAEPAAKATG
ncbi:MAG TPA: hypothetical protein VIL37_08250 [Natronosporangium sp.]